MEKGAKVSGDGVFCELRPTPRPPIYSVEVIEVACRALEAIVKTAQIFRDSTHVVDDCGDVRDTAIRIIRDGLASHEKAIRGEG